MNIKITTTLLLCLFGIKSIAQQTTSVTFHKDNGQKVSTLDSADFIRKVEPDTASKFYNLNEYYKDGKLKFASKTSKFDYIVLEGLTVNYFPSGRRREVANFADGKKIGDCYAYYPNGKLYTHRQFVTSGENRGSDYGANILIVSCADSTGKALATNGNGYYVGYNFEFTRIDEEGGLKDGLRDGKWKGDCSSKDTKVLFTEEYANGKLIAGESIVNDKDKYTYTQRMVQPLYKRRMQDFYEFIGRAVEYPAYARANNIQGTVLINFVVERDGTLSEFKTLKTPHPLLNIEAIRILRESPKWKPGMQYGRPVRVNYTLPIGFKL